MMNYVHKAKMKDGAKTIVFEDDKAYVVAPGGGGTWMPRGELEAYLIRNGGDGKVEIAGCYPGEYHPRIWRGVESPSAEQTGFAKQRLDSMLVCRSLASYVDALFSSIYPDALHFDVFGNKQRELLILASTDLPPYEML